MNRMIVIGGGVSGMMAAIQASERGAGVSILEHGEDVGKKILSTGNGRCNLTNMDMSAAYYRGSGKQIMDQVLSRFSAMDTREFFEELGLLTKTRDTYVYPRCDQAAAVAKMLKLELKRLNIGIYTDIHVEQIKRTATGFYIVSSDGQEFKSDAVILATGGRAAPVLGSDGSGYGLARSMGHTISPVVPALVQLKADPHPLKKAAGVRTQATVVCTVGKKQLAKDTGELLITDYGVSGIPVLQISRFASLGLYEGKHVEVCIDFLPELHAAEFIRHMDRHLQKRGTVSAVEVLSGIFPHKLAPRLLELSGIRNHTPVGELSAGRIARLLDVCRHTRLVIADTKGFEHAQVCAGGVPVQEICAETMESRLVEGLYIVGELLDVDGMCGGYNIQFALSSGYLAGISAAEKNRL